MDIDRVLSLFVGVRKEGDHYKAKCPVCQKVGHLYITPSGDTIKVYCQKCGAKAEDIAGALGISMAELLHGKDVSALPNNTNKQLTEQREHIYRNADGSTFGKKTVKKYDNGKKECFWELYTANGWRKGLQRQTAPIYGADKLTAQPDAVMFVVEGEKDVDTLVSLDYLAVSLPNGASQKTWPAEYTAAFAGRDVVIITDNDDPGTEYGQFVAEHINGAAASVKIVPAKAIWPDVQLKGDFSDIVAALGADEALNRLQEAIGNADRYTGIKVPAEYNSFLSCFRPLDDFEEEEATWLVNGWIPEGQITLLAADGGIGKTTLWCNIIAALSSGNRCVLDGEEVVRDPMTVAFLTTEDSVRKKLRKKLRLAGANAHNIITPDFAADRDGFLRNLKFGSNELAEFVRAYHPALCVFDPVQGFIPAELNMGSRNAMRDCMAPLIQLGEECGTTFLVICHTNKRKGAFGRDRIADSADLWDISRSVLMAGYTDEQGIRYLSNEKNNYSQLQETMLFSIDDDGQIITTGSTWKRDREFMQEAAVQRSAPCRDDCKDFILNAIDEHGGNISSKELEQLAKDAGYTSRTFRRAKDDIKNDGQIAYYTTGSAKDGTREWRVMRGFKRGDSAVNQEECPF